jgi:hypothetical protein
MVVVPHGIGDNTDLLAQTLEISIVERSLQNSNGSVVEVVRKIGIIQLSEWDWREQYRWVFGDIWPCNALPESLTSVNKR